MDAAPNFSHGQQQHLAEESIARDLLSDPGDSDDESEDDENGDSLPPESLARRVHRPSFVSAGPRLLLAPHQPDPVPATASLQEQTLATQDQKDLLRDNHLLPPSTSTRRRRGLGVRIALPTFVPPSPDRENGGGWRANGETTALLGQQTPAPADVDKQFHSAVESGVISTSVQREIRVLAASSFPLILTFLLQQSLTLVSIFTAGRLGTSHLGAVSLGAMTANITAYAVYHGLTTALDTLCPQAFGSHRPHLVGLQTQRMVLLCWAVSLPIVLCWCFCAHPLLSRIVPDPHVARLAAQYLTVLSLGCPGYAAFEAAKRYVQAQGLFAANLYVLSLVAPLNVLLHYLFVARFGWGVRGCAAALVVVELLMPCLLAAYVAFYHPTAAQCWPGLRLAAACRNWTPMLRLALPGLLMVLAEFLAFEILTLAAARLGPVPLAAQAILQSLSVLAYQLPFPLSVAGSTRLASLIGARLPGPAATTARTMLLAGAAAGCANAALLAIPRALLPRLYSSDPAVIALAAAVLPLNAAFQLADALAAQCNGILRAIGRQAVGGWVSLGVFYGLALPISFSATFRFDAGLYGLWTGPAVALLVQTIVEAAYIFGGTGAQRWERACVEAEGRLAGG